MLVYLFVENGAFKYEGLVSINLSEMIASQTNAQCFLPGPTSLAYLGLSPSEYAKTFLVDDETSTLSKEDLKATIEKIKDQKLRFYGKSLTALPLKLVLINEIIDKDYKQKYMDFCVEKNSYPLEEAVAKPGLTANEKISSLTQMLLEIGSAGNELTIVDPYIFPRSYGTDYLTVFEGIIKGSKATSVKIITYKNKTNSAIRSVMLSAVLPIPVTVYDADSYPDHDRYWIVKASEKAVHVGASLNGLGDKLCSLTKLTKNDTRIILDELSTIQTIF